MIEKLEQQLPYFRSFDKFVVAYSGGKDSTVLLDFFRKLFPKSTIAVHVNHGLSSNADQWEESCQKLCDVLEVELFIERVDATAKKGQSPEDAARIARYEVFKKYVDQNVCLLTAHNQNDQAETFLLQALRGAGTKGLASMPSLRAFGNGMHGRPLLKCSRVEIERYLATMHLPWVEDESNSSVRFDRNYLRHHVIPVITDRWLNACSTLSRVARHNAESQTLLDDLAQIDLQNVAGQLENALSITQLNILTAERQRNVLRYWISSFECQLPSTKVMTQIEQQILFGKADNVALIQWGGVELRRFRDDLIFMNQLEKHDPTKSYQWNTDDVLSLPNSLGLLTKELLHYPKVPKQVEVRFRQGGEVIKPAGKKDHHCLKKLFQQWGVVPWMRDRVPLIYDGEQLLEVVGYCAIDPFDHND